MNAYVRQGLKDRVPPLLGNPWVSAGLRWLYRDRLMILCYHRISAVGDDRAIYDHDLFIGADRFASQMEALASHFNPVAETEVIAAAQGHGRLPANPVWVTFDDGYDDNFQRAAPILRRYGIPATFFVTTDFIDGFALPWEGRILKAVAAAPPAPYRLDTGQGMIKLVIRANNRHAVGQLLVRLLSDARLSASQIGNLCEQLCANPDKPGMAFMNWEQIKQLAGQGFGIGSHTVSHRPFRHLDSLAAQWEMSESVLRIHRATGLWPRCFAYPYGDLGSFDRAERHAMLRRCGIEVAVTTEVGANRAGVTDRTALRRVGLRYRDSLKSFEYKLASGCFRPRPGVA